MPSHWFYCYQGQASILESANKMHGGCLLSPVLGYCRSLAPGDPGVPRIQCGAGAEAWRVRLGQGLDPGKDAGRVLRLPL